MGLCHLLPLVLGGVILCVVLVNCKIRQSRLTIKDVFESKFMLFLSLKQHSIH